MNGLIKYIKKDNVYLESLGDNDVDRQKEIDIICDKITGCVFRNIDRLGDDDVYDKCCADILIPRYIKIVGVRMGSRLKNNVVSSMEDEFLCRGKLMKKEIMKGKKKKINIINELIEEKMQYITRFIDPLSPEYVEGILIDTVATELFHDNDFWDEFERIEKLRTDAIIVKKANTTYTCNKCGGGVSSSQLQTRSIDEGITNFFKCIVCGHGWKN